MKPNAHSIRCEDKTHGGFSKQKKNNKYFKHHNGIWLPFDLTFMWVKIC